MNQVINRYQHVECRKSEGAHYTPEELSTFVASSIVQKSKSKEKLIIADPAIGDGELILSLLSEIEAGVQVEVYGFDINEESLRLSKSRIFKHFPNVKLNLLKINFLDLCFNVGTELEDLSIPKFDLVIANPPYIRTQVLGAEQSKLLAKKFGLKGKVDAYHAFLVGISKCLSKNGVAGFIVSNRFLTTKGAGDLRSSLFNLYDIHSIWDFGDTKLFEAAVLPAVLIFSNRSDVTRVESEFSSIYECSEEGKLVSANPVAAILEEGIVKCSNGKSYRVKRGKLDFDLSPKDTWRIKDAESDEWLKHVAKNTWARFGDVGKIRVGVKTTADNVFIRQNWEAETGTLPELLKPLITHHVAGRFRQKTNAMKSILYTHEVREGKKKAIDLNLYPVSKRYLEQHKEQLKSRKYVLKANRNWYEIWVPQNPSQWSKSKVVFRDICEEPTFWLDDGGSVVNGDCYWMTNELDSASDDILWLILAVANSNFIEKFYDTKFNNKLYSNKRRFITQYVEKFPLPNPKSNASANLVVLAKQIFNEQNEVESAILQAKLNNLVWEAFSLPPPVTR